MGKFRAVTYDDLDLRRFYLNQVCQGIEPDATVAYLAFQFYTHPNQALDLDGYVRELRKSFNPDQPDISLFDLIAGVEVINTRRDDISTLVQDMEARLVQAQTAVVREYGQRYTWISSQTPSRLFLDLVDPGILAKVAGHYDHPFRRFLRKIFSRPVNLGDIDYLDKDQP